VHEPATLLSGLRAGSGLGALPRRGVPDRHRTLAAAVRWSVELLDHRTAQVFRRLAVFAGGFTPAMATVVCVEPGTNVALAVTTLVDHSLVTVVHDAAGPRYRLLETVREQAWALLGEHDEIDTLRRRHLAATPSSTAARSARLPSCDAPTGRRRRRSR
jgi:predicted ATPase